MLANHGFIVEAGGTVGRNRPWQRSDATSRFGLRWFAIRDRYPKEWRDAAGDIHLVLTLSASELAELRRAVEVLVAPFRGRNAKNRNDAAEPVAFVLSALPLARPPTAPGGG